MQNQNFVSPLIPKVVKEEKGEGEGEGAAAFQDKKKVEPFRFFFKEYILIFYNKLAFKTAHLDSEVVSMFLTESMYISQCRWLCNSVEVECADGSLPIMIISHEGHKTNHHK